MQCLTTENAAENFRSFASLFTEKLFVQVAMYVDETGTHDPTGTEKGATVTGVSGFLAWPHDWAKFCQAWAEVLRDYNVPAFHFSEFADRIHGPSRPDWPYRDWPDEKRKEFLLRLATIAGQYAQFGLSAFFAVSDFNRIIPEWFRKNSAHPYDLCLKLFFEALLDQLAARWLPNIDTDVAFFFDQTTSVDWERSVRMIYRGVKESKDADNRMGSITFADMRKQLPLQAADMLTYRMRQVNEKLFAGEPKVTKKELDFALEQKPGSLILTSYNEASLKILADRLEQQRPMIEELYRRWKERHHGRESGQN